MPCLSTGTLSQSLLSVTVRQIVPKRFQTVNWSIVRPFRGFHSSPARHYPYPSASLHSSALDPRLLRLSTDQSVPITRAETSLLQQILPSWKASGALIPYPERVIVVQALRRCGQIIPEGRSRLPALFRFSGAEDPLLTLSSAALEEAQWWLERLSQPVSSQLSSLPPRELPLEHMEIYVDASTRGIGVTIDRRWLAWEFTQPLGNGGKFSFPQGHIGWAELIAIELALRALIAQGYSSCQVPVHVDSLEAIACFERGFSRQEEQNTAVRRIYGLQRASGILLKLIRVASQYNVADSLSLGLLPSTSRRFPALVTLPMELAGRLTAL
ncbi:unnamed protein product [Somion occarium]|uniref:RNase H type-1 domain-containing protein n=1 Tax=Somion occarium TaxID=3059160 RepID=A0ABP1DR40_9APHY